MATRADKIAADKSARLKAMREDGQALPPPTSAVIDEASPEQEGAPAAAPVRREESGTMVRLSVDLGQGLYDDLDNWMRTAARASGFTRFNRVKVIRALIRELLADPALAERVRLRVESDMRTSK